MPKLALLGGKPKAKQLPTWPVLSDSDIFAVSETLRSGKWFRYEGTQVEQAEELFRKYIGCDYALAVTNGTAALEMALACAGIGAGDEIIVPAYTFYSSASAISFVGATPVFCDIDLNTLNLNLVHVKKLITHRTRAIIPVHFGGYPVDMDALNAIAQKHDLFILEDCSHAHGSEYKGKKVGSFGNASTWSFQASKNLTSGEGGMVLTNDAALYDRMFSRHTCGRKLGAAWYEHHSIATNLRMTEMQGSLLIQQFARLETQTEERLKNAIQIDNTISNIPELTATQCSIDYSTRRAYHLYIFRYAPGFDGVSRERFIEALVAEGVCASAGYPIPLYAQPVYKTITPPIGMNPYAELNLPNVETLCKDAVWITQPCLLGSEENGKQIVDTLTKICDHIDELRT